MQIKMHDVRKALLEAFDKDYRKENYYKLPADFSTHPSMVEVGGLRFKALSQAEAQATSKTKATRPHRILVWDEQCRRWQFAGKYAQHCRMVHK
jgi:hypothetical protein